MKPFFLAAALLASTSLAQPPTTSYDVRAFGATGNGTTLDSPSINKAIAAASAAGGGTVLLPPGNYLATTIHLQSNISLYLDQGATLIAASPNDGFRYDDPEPNPSDQYQDFGHTHWHNSLLVGENLHDISLLGPGTIYGKGLVRDGKESRPKSTTKPGVVASATTQPKFGYPNPEDSVEPGFGNKSISLKLCRNVTLRDLTISHGGHFAILATGVDNLTIDNLKIDTNRDGIDLDCCRHVRVSNCSVNSPFDDGICPKSSYALGENRPCEDITITNCSVSGYDEGSFLAGTYTRDDAKKLHHTPTGRIKCGTESNGGFKNITISNCTFTYCRGLALESVDGALLEDIAISNITMRDIIDAPIFIRLGSRLRGPDSTPVGAIRRVTISNLSCSGAGPRQGILITGTPGHPVEDLTLSNIRLYSAGNAPASYAATRPTEQESAYPEPGRFGPLPAYALYARHVRNLSCSNLDVRTEQPDPRPAISLEDVTQSRFSDLRATGSPTFHLHNLQDFTLHQANQLPDAHKDKITDETR